MPPRLIRCRLVRSLRFDHDPPVRAAYAVDGRSSALDRRDGLDVARVEPAQRTALRLHRNAIDDEEGIRSPVKRHRLGEADGDAPARSGVHVHTRDATGEDLLERAGVGPGRLVGRDGVGLSNWGWGGWWRRSVGFACALPVAAGEGKCGGRGNDEVSHRTSLADPNMS